jgi:hypothetical protein
MEEIMKMSYEIQNIDPTQIKFCYRLDEYSCYGLRTGVCSLYLSDKEAEIINMKEPKYINRKSSVMHCRELAKSLLNRDYYNNKDFQNASYSIRMQKRGCGHYSFTDGQHRTCIAKHLGIKSMYVNVEKTSEEYSSYICVACWEKEERERENKKIINKLLSLFRKKKEKELPYHIIDEEYMEFKKENSYIKTQN